MCLEKDAEIDEEKTHHGKESALLKFSLSAGQTTAPPASTQENARLFLQADFAPEQSSSRQDRGAARSARREAPAGARLAKNYYRRMTPLYRGNTPPFKPTRF